MDTAKFFDSKRPSEVVQTLRSDGRQGESIPKQEYDNWSSFILSILSKETDVTLNGLIERANQVSTNQSKAAESKASWYILQVKRDLEARSLISIVPASYNKHTFFLQLTRQGLSKIGG